MTRPVFTRRAFLGGIGAASMGGLIPSLEAEAAVGTAKKRLILLTSPNGTVHTDWKPTATGTTLTGLSKCLMPLQSHMQDLLVLDGLGWQYGDGPGVDHMRICMMWNGTPMLTGNDFSNSTNDRPCGWGGGISVDQQVANDLYTNQMIKTPFKSLEFGVYQPKAHIYTRVSYAGPNMPLPTTDDPTVMFTRMFMNMGPNTNAADITKLRARRKSIMDAVLANLNSVMGKVSTSDKAKIDAHLTAVRSVETRLDNALSTPATACTAPTLPMTKLDAHANDNFPKISRLQLDLMTVALSCDMTRVVSLLWDGASGDIRFTWLGINTGHHTISHDTGATARAQMTQMHAWHSGEVAYLLDKLAAINEGGSTLLDNSLVVWGNELADGAAHSQQPIPVLLAGRAAGQIKTGRYIDYGKKKHNPLLVSICQMMGLSSVTKFGTLDDGSGPLQQLAG